MVGPERSTFGYRVSSPRPLRFQRAGGGHDTMRVVQDERHRPEPPDAPLLQWSARVGGRMVRASLYATRGRFLYHTPLGACEVDPATRTVWMPPVSSDVLWEELLWGVPALLCFLRRGDFSLHAAAVEVDGAAVVLGAPGGFGKSTLALAFHRHGYRVLSEDVTCCRVDPEPQVIPGPPLFRIRPDTMDRTPPAGTSVVLERSDRIYLAVDEERRGSGHPVPLRGVFLLRTAADEVRLERLCPTAALPDLWALNIHLPRPDGRARAFRQLTSLANTVPIRNLHRPVRMAALPDTVASVLRGALHP